MTYPCVDYPGLSIGEIHVWIVRLADDHHATADLVRILGQEERVRAAQFSFDCDRIRFIQAHGIVRRILSNYSDADASALTFARNRHGKPHLMPRMNGPNLQFSISHSGNYCMFAVRLDHCAKLFQAGGKQGLSCFKGNGPTRCILCFVDA